ncbi:MAG: M23 family metallopeptidase [Bacillota bacterium]|nr:M23 family metallopeptidase [Bacillota bacterium]
MDDIIVRPRNPRYNIPNKLPNKNRLPYNRNKKSRTDSFNLLEVLLKQLVLSIICLLLVFGVKSINTPVTKFLSDKVKLVATDNIDINQIYKDIDGAVKKLTGKLNTGSSNNGKTDINKASEDTKQTGNLQGTSNAGKEATGQNVLANNANGNSGQAAGISDKGSSYTQSSQKDNSAQNSKASDSVQNTQTSSADKKLIDSIKSKYTFLVPVNGTLSSPFGMRVDPADNIEKLHKGIDIAANKGVSIKAALSGTVIISGTDSTFGNYIEIDHDNGLLTLYAHCSQLLVKKGQKVKKGDIIGKVGDTGAAVGPHLHFEIRKDGIQLNPLEFIKVPLKSN